jgi:hypothetical protein
MGALATRCYPFPRALPSAAIGGAIMGLRLKDSMDTVCSQRVLSNSLLVPTRSRCARQVGTALR